MANWNKRFIDLAHHVASWSKDQSTQVGAVIASPEHRILSVGYNGFPMGANDDVESRHERPQKYLYTEHAERNAIYSAARAGVNISGCTIYIMLFPCADCARAIIQSGLSKVVCYAPDSHQHYKDSFEVAKELFDECNIKVEYI